MGRKSTTPLTLNINSFTPEKGPRHQLYRRLDGTKRRLCRLEADKNLSPLTGFEIQTVQPVSKLLYRLRYFCSFCSST